MKTLPADVVSLDLIGPCDLGVVFPFEWLAEDLGDRRAALVDSLEDCADASVVIRHRLCDAVDLSDDETPRGERWDSDVTAQTVFPSILARLDCSSAFARSIDSGHMCIDIAQVQFFLFFGGISVVRVSVRIRRKEEGGGNGLADLAHELGRVIDTDVVPILDKACLFVGHLLAERTQAELSATADVGVRFIHRLYYFAVDGQPDLSAYRGLLRLTADHDLRDIIRDTESASSHVGSGDSIFAWDTTLDDEAARQYSPLAVLIFYQYYWCVMTRYDRFSIESSVKGHASGAFDTPELGPAVRNWGRDVRILQALRDDFTNALSPLELAYWSAKMSAWRVTEVERGIDVRLDDLDRRLERLSQLRIEQQTARASRVITLLTSLTLIATVVAGVDFAINPSDRAIRGVFLVAAVAAALLTYAVTYRHGGKRPE